MGRPFTPFISCPLNVESIGMAPPNFHLSGYTYYFSCFLASSFPGREECVLVGVCVAEVVLAPYFGLFSLLDRGSYHSFEIWRILKPPPSWSWN